MTSEAPAVLWADPQREAVFQRWLQRLTPVHGLRASTLRPASADASFRRYLRIDSDSGASLIVMDAPPALENCRPFVQVARLMKDAGLRVPEVLDWDEAQGFMLLSDLGHQTLLEVIQPDHPQANLAHYQAATDALLAWQLASKPGVLPPYDEALLRRELQLFPDWYLQQHRQFTLEPADANVLYKAFDSIVAHNLASPSVYVHRDFMPRNLMIPRDHAPTLPLRAGRCPPRGLIRLGAARRRVFTPTLRRCAGRCPPRGLIRLGAARRRVGVRSVCSTFKMRSTARSATTSPA